MHAPPASKHANAQAASVLYIVLLRVSVVKRSYSDFQDVILVALTEPHRGKLIVVSEQQPHDDRYGHD